MKKLIILLILLALMGCQTVELTKTDKIVLGVAATLAAGWVAGAVYISTLPPADDILQDIEDAVNP